MAVGYAFNLTTTDLHFGEVTLTTRSLQVTLDRPRPHTSWRAREQLVAS